MINGMPDLTSGNCAGIDTEMYYPEKGVHGGNIMQLRRICLSDCPVYQACYDWSISHEIHGFWAGYTPVERRYIRNRDNIKLVLPESWIEKEKGSGRLL